jgi:hypothetical protein
MKRHMPSSSPSLPVLATGIRIAPRIATIGMRDLRF